MAVACAAGRAATACSSLGLHTEQGPCCRLATPCVCQPAPVPGRPHPPHSPQAEFKSAAQDFVQQRTEFDAEKLREQVVETLRVSPVCALPLPACPPLPRGLLLGAGEALTGQAALPPAPPASRQTPCCPATCCAGQQGDGLADKQLQGHCGARDPALMSPAASTKAD